MSKFKIVNLIDKLFISISIFLIIFAWINFYTRNLWFSFILSLLFSASCIYILHYLITKKHEKKLKTSKQIAEINDCFFNFRLLNDDEQKNFLQSNLKIKAEMKNGFLYYKKDNFSHLIYLATNFHILTYNDFLNIAQQTKNLEADIVEIICNESEDFNTNLFSHKQFKILNKTKFYTTFLLPHNTLPKCENLCENPKKIDAIKILKRFFLPQKAKAYFVCGLILIFSSVIIPNHFYYIIFGSMLLLFSIICKLKNLTSC